jgi:hypothetical protein
MEDTPLRTSLIISAFMIASGVFDAMAFTFAARMWQGGSIVWAEAAKSGCSFMLGITLYWVSVGYLSRAGVVLPEIQTLLWFGVTIIGVGVLGGRFADWRLLDQFVALNVLLSLGWLMVRTAAH